MKRARRLKIQRVKITSQEQWLALRTQDVTASTVAALFGLHPYETPNGLWAAKTGMPMPKPDSAVLRRGRLLETAVATAFREEHPGWKIVKPNIYLRAPTIRLGATPDFFVIDDKGRKGVLQAKTVSPFEFRRMWTDTTAPTWIALQTLTETMLARAEFGVIAALIVDGWKFELKTYDVPRHEPAERRIQDAVVKFWQDIEAGREPKIDYERDGALVAMMYPHETPGKSIDLRGDNQLPELLEERERLRAEIKQRDTRRQAIETEVRSKLGDAEIGIVTGWKVTWKEHRVKEYVVPASSYRQLSITREKS